MARDTTVTVGTNVNPEIRRQLRKLAADRDITVSELLRRQIDDLLADHELAADA